VVMNHGSSPAATAFSGRDLLAGTTVASVELGPNEWVVLA